MGYAVICYFLLEVNCLAVKKRNRSRRRSGEGENIPIQEGSPKEVRQKMRKLNEEGTE